MEARGWSFMRNKKTKSHELRKYWKHLESEKKKKRRNGVYFQSLQKKSVLPTP